MSFSIALSGLNASNSELNTISNNIANVSTTGFKESRTEFASVYSGSEAGGVEVVGVSQNFEKSGTVTGTGRSLDMALSGNGFFVLEDSKGQTLYTRSGIFNMNADGVITANSGAALQGYSVDGNNNLLLGSVGTVQISTASLQARETDSIEFVANLDAREQAPAAAFDYSDSSTYNHSYTTPVYDSLGNPHTVSQYFVKGASNDWDVHVLVDGQAIDGSDALVPAGSPTTTDSANFTFNADGTIASGGNYSVSFDPANGANGVTVNIDLSSVTQFGSDFVVSKNSPNGYTSGDYASVRMENDGRIFATYTNGQSQLQGQVVLADFAAPQNLIKTSDTAWLQSFSSGTPVLGTAGSGVFGDLTSGALEGSNVDLTSELVALMTAQRNYQANTKSISTSDQLTQALFNVV
ncbi:flagellar hook protein FlgE [Vibrio mediterranei]|uniref:flagellar hook protein FlgE n=1 Tax=Vibrio mediterranei TaxID=689 RepID=UPI00148D674C|nr:flagellar hook protein FlgE [Vibrio mediterranei]NOH30360.1 flagellar basal body protein FlaE [Vibrio mediterranei]